MVSCHTAGKQHKRDVTVKLGEPNDIYLALETKPHVNVVRQNRKFESKAWCYYPE